MPDLNNIYLGDNVDTMKTWPDGCVQTCVTSPPYYGLRDYGTPPRVWGGDSGHAHVWQHHRYYVEGGGGAGGSAEAFTQAGPENAARLKKARWREDDDCACGAWRGNLGLEPTPELFVAHLVEIFREVRRVLRDDGTLWLNLGDSYAGAGSGPKRRMPHQDGRPRDAYLSKGRVTAPAGEQVPHRRATGAGLKPKDLIGIPWMTAFALRSDGWYLRKDNIWNKTNPMPESCVDRCTTSHEYVFHLSKSEQYYYDADAIREQGAEPDRQRNDVVGGKKADQVKHSPGGKFKGCATRNKRSVWTVTLKPYHEAHFATFPPKLIEPCVLAGAPRGGVVLDPFMGAGTTALVAATHGRQFLGCELNPEYKAIADRRVANEVAQEKFL